jgi:copper(I)-binding protein
MRIPAATVVAGLAVAALGAAGLIRAAVPLGVSGGGAERASAPIVVTGAWVRQPAPPTDAAAGYFTAYNTTSRPDRLLSVVSGAGATSVLHTIVNGQMSVPADGAVVPAHGKLVLSVGTGHVMIQQLFGTLRPGQNVNMALTFQNAGTIDVSAPVVALGAAPPTGSSAPSPGDTK